MADPHPTLFKVAAGSPIDLVERPERLFRSAIDHRMSGLLASRDDIIDLMPDHHRLHLMSVQAALWAQNTALLDRLSDITSLAADVGIGLGAYKGVVTEQRWYGSVGERVVTDIDLLVDARDMAKTIEFVSAIDRTHPLLDDLPYLLAGGLLQSIDLRYEDVRVDVHFDPLKMELVPTVDLDEFWSTMETVELPGTRIVSPTPARTLVMTLLHTMRDRFRWLGAYADIARICDDPNLDWDEAERFAVVQGYLSPVLFALGRVNRSLGLDTKLRPKSAVALRLLWPEGRSLLGTPAEHPPPRSTLKLAVLAKGRHIEAARAWLRRLLPPRSLIDYYYPESRGPYFFRLIAARVGKRSASAQRLHRDRQGDLHRHLRNHSGE